MTWIEGSDWRIIDTWDTAGLRATGSHDIEVSDLFVPEHRTCPLPLPDPVQTVLCSASRSSDCSPSGWLRQRWASPGRRSTSCSASRTRRPRSGWRRRCRPGRRRRSRCARPGPSSVRRAFLVEQTAHVWEMVRAGTPASQEHQALLRLAATPRRRPRPAPSIACTPRRAELRSLPRVPSSDVSATSTRSPALLRRSADVGAARQDPARRRTRRLHALSRCHNLQARHDRLPAILERRR